MNYKIKQITVDILDKTIYNLTMMTNAMKTKHTAECTRVFKNYDINCPRCQELMKGAAPRQGWSQNRKRQDEQRIRDIKDHVCSIEKCGPVCTKFDW